MCSKKAALRITDSPGRAESFIQEENCMYTSKDLGTSSMKIATTSEYLLCLCYAKFVTRTCLAIVQIFITRLSRVLEGGFVHFVAWCAYH